jgi:hypothetical protein
MKDLITVVIPEGTTAALIGDDEQQQTTVPCNLNGTKKKNDLVNLIYESGTPIR